MKDEKSIPADVQENNDPKPELQPTFENSYSIVAVRPKAKAEVGFIYRGMEDIKGLIGFVGTPPIVLPDMSLKFKRQIVTDNSVVFRNPFGEVERVMKISDAENTYEILASHDYSDADAAKVKEKPSKGKK